MTRVALVAPDDAALTTVLGAVARAGVVELEETSDDQPAESVELELERVGAAAVRQDGVAAYVGWCPAPEVPKLAAVVAPLDGALVPLPAPAGVDPPTLLRTATPVRRELSALVETYGTVPYADVDPTVLAALAYVVMFGMMFGDAGHGLILLVMAALLRVGWPRRLARLHRHWPFVAGAGVASTAFGVLYGEFFGPTGIVPPVWIEPLAEPVRLLTAGVGLGAVLLAVAYAVGVVNRWREGSARLALYAFEGTAGMGQTGNRVAFGGTPLHIPVGPTWLGRTGNGRGEPTDGGPPILADRTAPVSGFPLNPTWREPPAEPVLTGISAVDALTTLVRGQKLPVFAVAGAPHLELATQLAAQAHTGGEPFSVVFAGMGLTHADAAFARDALERRAATGDLVLLLNTADDPVIERILTPRLALTIAEDAVRRRRGRVAPSVLHTGSIRRPPPGATVGVQDGNDEWRKR